MRDFQRTIISQFSQSPRLWQLIEDLNTNIDPRTNFEAFYDLIWNIDTAVGEGLNIWGRIVGINRVLTVTEGRWFGFTEATDASGWGQDAYWSGTPITSNFTLSDQAYRRLIFAKAAMNITDCSIPAINRILMELFPGRGNAYVTEGTPGVFFDHFGFQEAGDAEPFNSAPFNDFLHASLPHGMTMTYTFEFALLPFEISIVTKSGVLPKPVGVFATAVYAT